MWRGGQDLAAAIHKFRRAYAIELTVQPLQGSWQLVAPALPAPRSGRASLSVDLILQHPAGYDISSGTRLAGIVCRLHVRTSA